MAIDAQSHQVYVVPSLLFTSLGRPTGIKRSAWAMFGPHPGSKENIVRPARIILT